MVRVNLIYLTLVYFIKKGKRLIHENLIKVCIGLSLCFLVMYIAYHITSDPEYYFKQTSRLIELLQNLYGQRKRLE